ncbi:MAG: virulence RhuM family protein [Phascolarctobacterium sp.]
MADVIIYNTKDGQASIKLYAQDGTVWLTQAQIAELFDTTKQNVSLHISKIFKEHELDKGAVVKYYLTTGSDSKKYMQMHYNLEMILAIGFRVRSPRGTQFRQWANSTLKEYLQKGFVLDTERLKNPDGRPDYFDELLEQIRDIRASEKRFYQKLRDLFALSSDYRVREEETQLFFAETQNKLIYGVTGNTAAELIMQRADAKQKNMALQSWKGSIVRKADVIIAKNYLQSSEIDLLNRLVMIFLESAELRVKLRKDLTLDFWRASVDKLLVDHEIPLLENHGKVSMKQAQMHAREVYEEFDSRRKAFDAAQADEQDIVELDKAVKELEKGFKK